MTNSNSKSANATGFNFIGVVFLSKLNNNGEIIPNQHNEQSPSTVTFSLAAAWLLLAPRGRGGVVGGRGGIRNEGK